MKRTLLWLLGIVTVLTFVSYYGADEIGAIVTQINPLALLVLCLLQVFTLGMTAYQWHFLIRQSHGSITFPRAFAIFLTGSFVESVTPSVKFGGEAAKLYLYRRDTGLSYAQLSGILAVHKYMSMLPFFLLTTVLLLKSINRWVVPTIVYYGVSILALVLVSLMVILLRHGNKNPKGPMAKIFTYIGTAVDHGRSLLSTRVVVLLSAISLVVWVLYPIKVWSVVYLLGFELDFPFVVFATFSAYVVGLIPALPGSLGTFEASMAFFLAQFGLTPASALAVTVAARFITFWFPLVFSGLIAYGFQRSSQTLEGREGARVISPRTSKKKQKANNCRIATLLLQAVKGLEELGAQCIPLGRIYTALFYQKMIAKEAMIGGLQPGMRVLHIGSGRLPMTAISLAQRGLHVDAMDHDPRAVDLSRRVISALGCDEQVKVLVGDGCQVDCSGYDAILLSLHVIPKDKVIAQVLQSLQAGGRLIYRNPRGFFSNFYVRVNPGDLANQCSYKTATQSLGKETVVIHKNIAQEVSGTLQSAVTAVSLSSLAVGDSGIIMSATEISQARSMGIRRGKQVTVETNQHFGGPYNLSILTRSIAVPRPLAAKIQLSKLGDSHETKLLTATA